MRRISWALVAVAAVAAVASFALAAPAFAGVSGAEFTTVNPTFDKGTYCANGNPAVNCNQYAGKQYVWLNGGPAANKLGGDGKYFFAVLAPGGQADPNDGTAKNLSDDYDCWQNREFTVINGEISAYTPDTDPACNHTATPGNPTPHIFANGLIRLYNYADTPNSGGVYIAYICRVPSSVSATNPPGVSSSSCKYDAFKVVPQTDITPPTCTATTSTVNGTGVIQITVQDLGTTQDPASGIDTIVPTPTNASVTYTPADWYPGTQGSVVVTATQTDVTQTASLSVTVTDVAGLSTSCHASVPPVDKTPPSCTLYATGNDSMGRKYIQVFVQDTGSGLKSIDPSANNATLSIGSFTSGTKDSVVVTATKTDQQKGAYLKLVVTDQAGNQLTCDPVLPGTARIRVGAARSARVRVSAEQSSLLIRSSSRISSQVVIRVNGRIFRVRHLRAGSSHRLDLSAAMIPGRRNVVEIENDGRLGTVSVLLRAK